MSASELATDLLHFNFTHAYERLKDWYSGWPPALKSFVSKLTDDEGIIIWNAAAAALPELGSKPILQVADEVWEQIKDQVPLKAKSDLLDALGLQSRAS